MTPMYAILIVFAVTIALGAWAVYLSWTTNTRMGYPVPDKLLYAFGAGIFGPFYIAHYYITRADCCLPKAAPPFYP